MTIARVSLSSLNKGPSKKRSVLAGNDPILSGAYESIATVTLSSSQTTITFSSIPSTYKHLQIRGIGRTTRTAATTDAGKITFNSDTAGNYSSHSLYGTGSAAGAYAYANDAFIYLQRFTTNAATSGMFGAFVMDVLDYANTNKYKTVKILGAADLNGSGELDFQSGLWRSTSTITSISFDVNSGSSWTQYSSFALYGIK